MGDDELSSAHYPNVMRAVLAQPWAIDHESLAWGAIVDILALRSVGRGLTDEEITARVAGAQNGPRQGGGRSQGVGIQTIPVYGVITPRGNMMARSSGGVTAESILSDFRGAMADPAVDGIVFDMDSPGGVMEGMAELTAEIRAARGTKPIVAVANFMAASACYLLASACDEIIASPSAIVGSIGVFTAHDDISEAQAKLGVKRTVITAGKHKAEGALGQPLSDEARAHVQGQIDEIYGGMTADIAKGRSYAGRKVTVDTVRSEAWGEGRSLLAKGALAVGMVDGIDTLENTIKRVARGVVNSQRAAALGGPIDILALALGLPFSERLALASALTADIAASSQARADLRAEDGRSLSAATRNGLTSLGQSVLAIAGDPDPDAADDEEDEDETETPAEPTARAVVRGGLEVLEAALKGGYALNQ